MWVVWILVALASVTGYYTMTSRAHELPVAAMKNEDLAGNMAVYRGMVMNYLAAHPEVIGPAVVSSVALQSVQPAWYTPSPLWANHVSVDGMITIYAATLPPAKITSQIVDLSQRSILAGEARASLAAGNLYSPIFGNTNIPLPTGVSIPDGSPVWMARRTQS
jgi:hypothetical protein